MTGEAPERREPPPAPRIPIRGIIGLAFAILGGIAIAWERHGAREQFDEVVRLFPGGIATPEMIELEHMQGLSQLESASAPQVARPLREMGRGQGSWAAYAVDRMADVPPLASDARGVAVRTDDPALSLDPFTGWLPEDRVPRTAAEVSWVAFTRRTWVDGLYEIAGRPIRVERLDVRVVRVADGALIGRVTTEGVPPDRASEATESAYPVYAPVAATALVHLLDEQEPATPAAPPTFPTDCFEASLPPLDAELEQMFHPSCLDGATLRCISECEHGSAGACVCAATGLANDSTSDPLPLYRRACEAGAPTGCRAFGAAWLAEPRASDEGRVCARGLLRRACEAGDPAACTLASE